VIFSETLTLQSHMLFNTVCMSQRCRRFMLLTGHFPTWFLVFCTCSTIHKPLSRLDSVEFKRTPSGGLSSASTRKTFFDTAGGSSAFGAVSPRRRRAAALCKMEKNRLQPGEWQMPNRLSSPATSTPSY
jgi:hypothetical protein